MSTYSLYKAARNNAWQTLITYKLTSFPLDITGLCESMGLDLFTADEAQSILKLIHSERKTLCTDFNKRPIMILDTTAPLTRQRFSVAHELGHYVNGDVQDGIGSYNEYQENAANIYASRILMPAIVCHIEQLHSAEQIADFFGVSRQAAEIRAERIAELERRNKWLTSHLEAQYYNLYTKTK